MREPDMYAEYSMAVPLDPKYKNQMEVKLTLRIAEAIKSGELPGDQLAVVCQDVLDHADAPTSKEEYVTMVEHLTKRHPIFSPVLMELQKQQQAAKNVDEMFVRNPTPQ